MIRTTIYIDKKLLEKLKNAMDILDLPKKEVISLLISRIIRKNHFIPRPCKSVKYQDEGLGLIVWKTEHIDLDPVFYEKDLDLRRKYKFSFSWFVAFAIRNYLDELVSDLINPGDTKIFLDNYERSFVYIARVVNGAPVFITMLAYPGTYYLEKLLKVV